MLDAPARNPESSEAAAPIARTVQLQHTLPNGDWHIDWMLTPAGQAGDCDARLITFRLPKPLHELPPGSTMAAERIADHRHAYLTYEGPVSGNRGEVRRVAAGQISRWSDPESLHWTLAITWQVAGESMRQRITVARDTATSDGWTIACENREQGVMDDHE